MSVETKERKVQDALGLGKEFVVTIKFDGTCTAKLSKSIKAVSKEDAEEQIFKILAIETDDQIHHDIINHGSRAPSNDGGGGFNNLKVDRNSARIARVYELNAPKMELDGESEGVMMSTGSKQDRRII